MGRTRQSGLWPPKCVISRSQRAHCLSYPQRAHARGSHSEGFGDQSLAPRAPTWPYLLPSRGFRGSSGNQGPSPWGIGGACPGHPGLGGPSKTKRSGAFQMEKPATPGSASACRGAARLQEEAGAASPTSVPSPHSRLPGTRDSCLFCSGSVAVNGHCSEDKDTMSSVWRHCFRLSLPGQGQGAGGLPFT